MPTQGFIQLNTDGTGKKLDTVITATAAQVRQVFVQGDNSLDANTVNVINTSLASISNGQFGAVGAGVLYAMNGSALQAVNTDGSGNLKVSNAATATSTVNISNFPAVQNVSATIGIPTVNQGTNPWLVQATIGIPTVNQGSAPWTVNASIQGILNVNATLAGNLPVTASISGTIPVSGTFWQATQNVIATIANASIPVTESGAWNVTATIGNVVNALASIQGQVPVTASIIGQLPVTASIIGQLPVTATYASPWGVTATIGNMVNVLASIQGIPNIAVVSALTLSIGAMPSQTFNATIAATVYQGGAPWLVNASVIGQLPVTASIAGIPAVNILPSTTGGYSTYTNTLGATIATVKASAGQIFGYHIYNANATQVYVQLLNASVATLGTTAPFMSLGIPAQGGATWNSDIGIPFSAPIMVGVSQTRSGAVNPAASVDLNLYYF